MEKILRDPVPEIIYGSSDSVLSRTIRKDLQSGHLRQLAPRLYTSNLEDTPAQIIKRNLYHILGHFYPKAVISHKTAFEGGTSKEGVIYLSYKYTKKIVLPGFTIHLMKGHSAVEGDSPFVENLFLASRERALLENLQPSRTRGQSAKTVSIEIIEKYLDNLCRIYGIEELNRVRDKARHLANVLNMQSEFKKLDKLIGELHGTKEINLLKSESAIARAKGIPYDTKRLELFAQLAKDLQTTLLPLCKSNITNTDSLNNLAFFEAYFSNYIEGTEFEIEEAHEIIFENKIIPKRIEDSHDILGTFKIVSSLSEMRNTPSSYTELIEILQHRHAVLMTARKDKDPGKFKNKINRAGNTVFVNPTLVTGTLIKSFDLYQNIKPGLMRAMFMMFIITEIHPFLDGNGRIARIMMNAELEREAETRIIIPTVFREDYLLALRRLSRETDSEAYVRMLLRAQEFTSKIDFSNYQHALTLLTQCDAFKEPSEGKLKLPR